VEGDTIFKMLSEVDTVDDWLIASQLQQDFEQEDYQSTKLLYTDEEIAKELQEVEVGVYYPYRKYAKIDMEVQVHIARKLLIRPLGQ
jgi:hypothetical protein